MYKHRPLDTTKKQIRLLRLCPRLTSIAHDARASPIQCEVERCNVEEARYIALSYTWGPPTPTHTIQLNGKPFEVRQGLFNFLQAFRDDDANCQPERPYLWIDQLCIDQANALERNHQVRLMPDIYERSQQVVVWLHGHGPLQKSARLFQKSNGLSGTQILLCNQYFTRLWIAQEVFLAPRATIFCGGLWLSWDRLNDHVRKEAYRVAASPAYGPDYSRLRYLFNKSESLRLTNKDKVKPKYMSLRTAIDNFGWMECQDPHDKVYGLLGLVYPNQRPAVDYAKSLSEVLSDVLHIVGHDFRDAKELVDFSRCLENSLRMED